MLVCYFSDHSFDPFDHTRTLFTAHNLRNWINVKQLLTSLRYYLQQKPSTSHPTWPIIKLIPSPASYGCCPSNNGWNRRLREYYNRTTNSFLDYALAHSIAYCNWIFILLPKHISRSLGTLLHSLSLYLEISPTDPRLPTHMDWLYLHMNLVATNRKYRASDLNLPYSSPECRCINLHDSLCLGQSATWHLREQYCSRLHAVQTIKAFLCFLSKQWPHNPVEGFDFNSRILESKHEQGIL